MFKVTLLVLVLLATLQFAPALLLPYFYSSMPSQTGGDRDTPRKVRLRHRKQARLDCPPN
jgi:hypothetical protein